MEIPTKSCSDRMMSETTREQMPVRTRILPVRSIVGPIGMAEAVETEKAETRVYSSTAMRMPTLLIPGTRRKMKYGRKIRHSRANIHPLTFLWRIVNAI